MVWGSYRTLEVLRRLPRHLENLVALLVCLLALQAESRDDTTLTTKRKILLGKLVQNTQHLPRYVVNAKESLLLEKTNSKQSIKQNEIK